MDRAVVGDLVNDGAPDKAQTAAPVLPTGRLTRTVVGSAPLTYGTIVRLGSFWVIECESHVRLRLKRWLGRVDPSAVGQIRIKRSPEIDCDVQTFLDRYPLEMTEEDHAALHAGAETHRRHARVVAQVLAGDYEPRTFDLAVPLRDYQRVAADLAQRLKCLLIGDDTGVGKCQPLDATVLTASGFRRMGDLVVGDAVTDPDGGFALVEAVFPKGERVAYRVTVDGGESTEACSEHLWLVKRPSQRHLETVLSTADIFGLLAEGIDARVPVRRSGAPLVWERVRSVSYSRTTEMRCIRVGTKRHLYVTDGGIVTHNTAEAIAFFADPAYRPVLVVTPGGAIPEQWKGQVERFLPAARVHILKSSRAYDYTAAMAKEERAAGLPVGKGFPDVFVAPYTRIGGHVDSLGPKLKALVFDECKSLRHGGEGDDVPAKWKAARALRDQVTACVGLDATPAVNYGSEFWAIMECVSPGSLGSLSDFRREWCTQVGRHYLIKDSAAFGFYLRESGLHLRRTRMDVGQEMAPMTIVPTYIDADTDELDKVADRAHALARAILDQTMGKGAGWTKTQASGELERVLRQATGISKAKGISDFLRMLAETGEPVLCALWHRSVYDIIGSRLKDLRPAFYTGAESTRQKVESLERFKSGDTKILCMSLRSGEALDGLQYVCRTAVVAELDWSNVIHHQFFSRIDRPGQKDKVVGYYLLSRGGSDETMADVCGAKQANYEPISNPDPKMLAEVRVDPAHVRKLAEQYIATRRRGG